MISRFNHKPVPKPAFFNYDLSKNLAGSARYKEELYGLLRKVCNLKNMKSSYNYPKKDGNFDVFGGNFAPRPLKKALKELQKEYETLKDDPEFLRDLTGLYREYAGRPSGLYFAERLSEQVGTKVYLKREDLNHTGAHKINNTLGQALVAKKLGKSKLIAETGAGQHGVATATAAALLGLDCDIYMGTRDIKAQKPNVYRMKILGAELKKIDQGQGTLKDAVDVALENYAHQADDAHYLLGSVVGPHPYPEMVRNFQKVIGKEIKTQVQEKEGCLPSSIIACVGGGSNAMGAFYEFVTDTDVELVAVEPAGKGADTERHGLALGKGKTGIIHAFKSLVLQNADGEVAESYSAASGLDYPSVGPELSMLKEKGRIDLAQASDEQAVKAFVKLSRLEGIIPALESAHAVSYILRNGSDYSDDDIVVINLSGRGDKDVENVYEKFLK